MKKTYCDICKKEIKIFEISFTVNIQSSELRPHSKNRYIPEVCESCTDTIKNFMEGIENEK